MATSITPPQAAPEAVAPASQPVVETTSQVVTPQQQSRADVYNQYASLYEPNPPSVVEPVAPAEPEPVAVDPSPVVSPEIQEMRQAIQDLQAVNARLIQQLTPQPVAPTPPAGPAAPVVHPMQKWMEFMAENKLDEAEQFFLETYGPKFAAKLQPQFVEQSVAANRAEVEIERFVTQFEASNADLLPLRDYVALGAERRLQVAQNEKRITDPASFVREYQKAVTEEANALREKFQLARGAGKQEALTTKQTVLSATTLTPDTISSGQPSGSQQPSVSSPLDYLAMRQKRMLATQGFGSN